MDDTSLQDLENELKALRPRRPSVLLRARVEHELSPSADAARPATAAAPADLPTYTSATTLRSWKWFSWQMAAAASVALAVSLAVWHWQSAEPAATRAPEPELAQATPTAAPPRPSSSRRPWPRATPTGR
ncbi:hypothetical protein [Oleiharenicola sp. Vm1]|uniref:hypothetical protein n=1 Tax=Oleiharenicola sp. Vm1 TaxID=3398393 RepID=UPI0039F57D70